MPKPRIRMLLVAVLATMLAVSVLPALIDHNVRAQAAAAAGDPGAGASESADAGDGLAEDHEFESEEEAEEEHAAEEAADPEHAAAEAEEAEEPEPVFQVQGRLTDIASDSNPSRSGIQGSMVVNGLTFIVPVTAVILLGHEAGEEIAWSDVTASPSLVNRAIVIASGRGVPLSSGPGPESIRWIADDIVLQDATDTLVGIITTVQPSHVTINGVDVRMETDFRFARLNLIQDILGQPIDMDELPEGQLATVVGSSRAGGMRAQFIEVQAIVPPSPGEADWLRVDRADLRESRGEVLLRGVTNNLTATISVFEWVDGARGTLLAADVPVGPDGEWVARAGGLVFASSPVTVEVATSNGGHAIVVPEAR